MNVSLVGDLEKQISLLEDNALSDSLIIDFRTHQLQLQKETINLYKENSPKCVRPFTRMYSDKNFQNLKNEVESIDWQPIYDCTESNLKYELFIKELLDKIDKCFPLVRISRKRVKDKKWINRELCRKIKHKNYLYKN